MTQNPLIIDVSRLQEGGESLEGAVSPELLDLHESRPATPVGPISFNLRAEVVSHELIVSGGLAFECRVECCRCAEIYSTTVRVSSFLRAYEVPTGSETVDLTADVREDILLNLPSFPLCSESCKGLCPECGKNLNEGPCGCVRKDGGNMWAALDELKLPDDKKP